MLAAVVLVTVIAANGMAEAGVCSSSSVGAPVPNPADPTCSTFVQCGAGGTEFVMNCPAGLKFNAATASCDWPANVPNCGSAATTTTATVRTSTASTTTSRASTTTASTTTSRAPTTTASTTTSRASTASTTTTTTAKPTTTTSSGGSCSGKKKVVCYYPNWAYWRTGQGQYGVPNINAALCTHIVYAFAVLDTSSFGLTAFDSYLDLDSGLGNLRKFTALRQSNPGLKLLLALGGWTDSQQKVAAYKSLLASSSNQNAFLNSALQFLSTYGFDGLDIDYEFPDASDKTNFAKWMTALKAGLAPKGYQLTAAISAADTTMKAGLDVPSLAQSLDAFHLMAYDFHGSWESSADHHAPLLRRSWDTTSLYSDYAVRWLVSSGCPSSKIVLGVPTYGRSFTLTSSSGSKSPPLASAGAGTAGPITQQAGVLAYSEICSYVKNNGWTSVEDTNGPYAYNGNQWVGYHTPKSTAAIASYAVSNNLGGAMIWDLSTDDFRNSCGQGAYPILTSINNVFKAACP